MLRRLCCALGLFAACVWAHGETYTLKVLPAEHRSMTDPETGAELTFLTTDPAHDQNLYYEQRSWLSDSSLILFNSSREGGGLMGYRVNTGELVVLRTLKGALGAATAAKDGPRLYAMRGADVVELALEMGPSPDPLQKPSIVIASERVICTLGADRMRPTPP
jgi:oligogalacturonide lyase